MILQFGRSKGYQHLTVKEKKKKELVMKPLKHPLNWTNSLARPWHTNMDMTFGTCSVRNYVGHEQYISNAGTSQI